MDPSKSRQRRVLSVCAFVVVVALVLAVCAVVFRAKSEPLHDGKPLRVWLRGFDDGYGSSNWVAAENAIKQMGTNVLPFLIGYLREKDPPFHRQLLRVKGKLGVLRPPVDYATDWHRRAAHACAVFGEGAEPAFPALVEAANDRYAADDVAISLSRMLPRSAPVLTNLIVVGGPSARMNAAQFGLGSALSHPSVATMARTTLINALLHDPEDGVRMSAASALGLGRDYFESDHFEIIVPALIQALDDPNPGVRGNAATTLGSFGTNARPAIPKLTALLQDTSPYLPQSTVRVCDRVKDMLLRIDPQH